MPSPLTKSPPWIIKSLIWTRDLAGMHSSMVGGRNEWNPYHPVELGSFVALGPALRVLRLASAELAEVLRGARGDVGEELHFDAAQRLPYRGISR